MPFPDDIDGCTFDLLLSKSFCRFSGRMPFLLLEEQFRNTEVTSKH